MSEVERISVKGIAPEIPVSLRGSVADRYCRLLWDGRVREADEFMREMLSSSDANIVKFKEQGSIVIGLLSDRGRYLPDW